MPAVHTFSIVARDPETGDLGVAVASKFLAVGAVVPWAKAGVGAVATQSYANPSYGPRALQILEAGGLPRHAHEAFYNTDPDHALRQYGIVSTTGESFSFTGEGCHDWAGGHAEADLAVQGNLLAGPEVIEALRTTFWEREDLPFPERLVAALLAGDRAGGDRRGRQSAALLVVGVGKGYGGYNDRWIDLRVDDHPDPVPELERLLTQHRLLFSPPKAPRPLTPEELAWLEALLVERGFLETPRGRFDTAFETALKALLGEENLEERYPGGPELDEALLGYLKRRFA